jgi:uncharacterized protein (TIGR03067 family)
MRPLGILLVLGLLLGADDKGKDPAKKDRDLLQGKWRVMAMETLGVSRTYTRRDAQQYWTFSDNKVTIKVGDNKEKESTFELSAKEKPRVLKIKPLDASKKEPVRMLFYEVDGDYLRLCLGSGNRPPKDFTSQHEQIVVRMKREKEKKK